MVDPLPLHRAGGEAGDDADLEHEDERDERHVTITDAAMTRPQGSSNWEAPDTSAISTGTVRRSSVSVKVSAKRIAARPISTDTARHVEREDRLAPHDHPRSTVLNLRRRVALLPGSIPGASTL